MKQHAILKIQIKRHFQKKIAGRGETIKATKSKDISSATVEGDLQTIKVHAANSREDDITIKKLGY
jgi:hypothetical protein